MLLARAVANGTITPDERVGDFTLFSRDRLPEIATALLAVARREPARVALREKLAEFHSLSGPLATLFYQKNRDEIKLAAALENETSTES